MTGPAGGLGRRAPCCWPRAWPSAAAAAAIAAHAASACPAKTGKAVTASSPVTPTGKPAAGWTLPGADLANTRDVASAITSANVSKLGVAWTVPLHTSLSHTDGAYATTPVIVNGVVYVQDLQSNVMAISLATGRVLWTHTYNSPNGGPDGVNVVGGVVYGATNHAAFALDAATGRQLWSRNLIGNDHEGIDMTPGYDHGTVYVSTVPVNPPWASTSAAAGPPVGAERRDRRAGVGLGRGTGPVGAPVDQLRRRPVVRAVVRRPGRRVYRRGQPRPALRHQELPAGEQPAGS